MSGLRYLSCRRLHQGDVQRAHQGLAQHDRRPGGGGFAQGSTTVREVPRGSSTSTVYTGWPCSTPIPASARLPRHRHGLQQRAPWVAK